MRTAILVRMKKIEIHPCKALSGTVSIPGDKSISHRALMFASLADGVSTIDNLLEGHDCIATLQVMRALGVHISLQDGSWIVKGCKKLRSQRTELGFRLQKLRHNHSHHDGIIISNAFHVDFRWHRAN